MTTTEHLPAPAEHNGQHYRFFVVDAPEEGDEHHAEIRVNTDPNSRENKKRSRARR